MIARVYEKNHINLFDREQNSIAHLSKFVRLKVANYAWIIV